MDAERIHTNKVVAILSKFTVLCLSSYFVVYFFKLKFIWFYNRFIYYYTRIFLILLPHPVYIYIYTYTMMTHIHKITKLKKMFCKGIFGTTVYIKTTPAFSTQSPIHNTMITDYIKKCISYR